MQGKLIISLFPKGMASEVQYEFEFWYLDAFIE